MGARTQKKWGPKGGGPEGWGARRVEPEGWGAQNFALFLLSPTGNFIRCSLSGGFLVEFWWCLKRRDAQMCAFGVLWLSCEAPAARSGGAAGVPHDSARAQTCTFERPGLQKHHQNSTRKPTERRKKEISGGREKKSEILGGPGKGLPAEEGPGERTRTHHHTHKQQAPTGTNRQQPATTRNNNNNNNNNNQEKQQQQTTTKTMTTTTTENLAKTLKHQNWRNAVWPNAVNTLKH